MRIAVKGQTVVLVSVLAILSTAVLGTAAADMAFARIIISGTTTGSPGTTGTISFEARLVAVDVSPGSQEDSGSFAGTLNGAAVHGIFGPDALPHLPPTYDGVPFDCAAAPIASIVGSISSAVPSSLVGQQAFAFGCGHAVEFALGTPGSFVPTYLGVGTGTVVVI